MQSSVYIDISDEFFREVDSQLAKLELIDRRPVLLAGVRKGLGLVRARVRAILPRPGYPGDKRGLKALRDTLKTKVREYGHKVFGIVGYEWGAGSHGHIVEHGHDIVVGGTSPKPGKGRKTARKSKRTGRRGEGRIVGWVEGRFYMERAVKQLGGQIEAAMVEHITKAIDEATS